EGYEYGSFHFLEPSFLHNYTDSTAVNFSTKDITIRDTVSVIGFVIVFLTVVPLAIYRKNKKNSVAFWLP
ncbi:hypothetical protein ABNE52_19815, partial [Paenibacillus larvae]